MKYYKSTTNQPFAFESDGSQDYLIPNDYVPITQEEAIILGKEWAQKYMLQPIPNEPAIE